MNAVTGDGSSHGQMDDNTLNGADPNDVAITILDRVAAGKTDFIVAAPLKTVLAIWLKLLFPSFLESQMIKRFEKSKAKKD